MKKIFIFILALVLLTSVIALETTYNPFTGKLDYVLKQIEEWVDISGDTMTGNLTMESSDILLNETHKICLDGKSCIKWICANSTDIIISNNESGISC